MSQHRKTVFSAVLGVCAILLLPSLLWLLPGKASGASLSTSYIRLNRLKTAQNTSVRVVFKAASSQTANVVVDFNGADGASSWTSSSGVVNATQTVATATCAAETGFTALPGTLTAAGSSGTVTVSGVTATTSATTYCFDLTSTSAVTNPTASEYHPTITIGTDSTTVAVRTISEDSYNVTATVSPTFNFALNNTTTDTFGTLSTSSTTSTTGKTITLTTNATAGWIVWVKSTNGTTKGSLNSTTAGNYKITSSSNIGDPSHTMTNGTEDYGLATTIGTDASGGGTVSLDAAYDGSSSKVGVLDSQNFRPIASSNGTASGDVLNVLERATISGATPAANDYTDTLTFIGAGNF